MKVNLLSYCFKKLRNVLLIIIISAVTILLKDQPSCRFSKQRCYNSILLHLNIFFKEINQKTKTGE